MVVKNRLAPFRALESTISASAIWARKIAGERTITGDGYLVKVSASLSPRQITFRTSR